MTTGEFNVCIRIFFTELFTHSFLLLQRQDRRTLVSLHLLGIAQCKGNSNSNHDQPQDGTDQIDQTAVRGDTAGFQAGNSNARSKRVNRGTQATGSRAD